MVEGHGCHRVVAAHKRLLLGNAFRATSPNKRFTEGAQLINGKTLTRLECVGKNLFYFFEGGAQPGGEKPVVVHIHFGMSGAFSTAPLPGPPPKPTTRLLLVNEEINITASLSAMTVAHGGPELYEMKYKALGPDPLREDADKERLWTKMQKTGKSVGACLMAQDFVAGIGNIYRAEILFKAGIHPEQPADTLSREQFEDIWGHSVLLLQRGFKTGSILTVDPDEAAVLGPPWTRRYIYNHKKCGRCGSAIKNWQMNARTVYCCPTCQPLLPDTQLQPARQSVVKNATPGKEFVSHCASEGTETLTPTKMTMALLSAELLARGLPSTGKKALLVSRLTEALETAAEEAKKKEKTAAATSRPSPATPISSAAASILGMQAPRKTRRSSSSATKSPPVNLMDVKPGTLHLGDAASARRAAIEKRKAGENRAVEHVALHDEEEESEISQAAKGKEKEKGKGKEKKKRRRTDSMREWSADVAVPGSAGLMDEVLAMEIESTTTI